MNVNDQKLINLAEEYQRIRSIRGLGLTTAIIEATTYTNGLLLVHNQACARDLKYQYPKLNAVPYTSTTLRGIQKPVFLDNYLEHIMIGSLLKRINELEQQVKKYETK